jgi:hypothetical protein
MDEQLIYCIASKYIVLHTPAPEVTASLLPSYEPFRVAELPEGVEPLFSFSGGVELDTKKRTALLEDKTSEGVRAQVYHTDDRQLLLELTISRRHQALCVDRSWRTIVSDVLLDDPSAAVFINRLIMIAFGVAIAPHRMLKMHASVTVLDGQALLFLGVSGTGKSTHSRLWRKFVPGATLLNDDEPIVRVLEDGEVRVYGCPWSGSTPCYKNESARVKAFVYLHQSPENKLSRLRGRDSFDAIYSSSAFLHSDKVRHLAMFDTVADVLERIPVYRLDCRPDEEAVSLTRQLLD